MSKNSMKKISIEKAAVIFIITFFLFPVSNLFAQTILTNDSTVFDPAHQFLWFQGHWNPKNKKQFIIDKDSSIAGGIGSPGGTITVESDGAVHLNTTGITEWNKKIDESLKIIDDWENNIEHPVSADLVTYDLDQTLLPDVKADKQEYTDYKIDPKTDILNTSKEEQEKQGMNNLVSSVTQGCQNFKSSYDNIIAYWKAHKQDKDADLNIPPPPEFTYDCYACDTNLRKIKDTLIKRYVSDFFHPEDSLISMGLRIIRDFALIGMGPASDNGGVYDPGNDPFSQVRDLFNTNKKEPSKSGSCSYLDLYTLNDAVKDIFLHEYRRSQELLRRYRKDYRAIEAITKVSLSCSRMMALFYGTFNLNNTLEQLAPLVGQDIYSYTNKLKQHDWKQLGNIPFILSLMRDKSLISGNSDNTNLYDLYSIMSDIMNNTYLSIDMDIKIGKDGGYTLCHLKGESKIAIDFVQQENKCYRWVLAEDEPKVTKYWKGGDKYSILEIPVKKQLQKIDVDLLANQIILPGAPVPVYAGTKKYYALLKNLKMDFCHPGDDSIILTTFVPSPNAMAGLWNIPNSKPAPLGINGMDHFFQDQEKMEELANSGEAQEQSEIMQKQGEELKAKMQALAAQMGNGRTKADMDKYEQLQKMASQMQDLANNTNISPMLGLSFKIPVQNDPVMVDKKFDAKELSSKEAEAIVYGFYTIKIEYRK